MRPSPTNRVGPRRIALTRDNTPLRLRPTHLVGQGRIGSLGAVEDRHTAGLYLELTDEPVDAYVAERMPAVLGLAGVERATWWRNVKRDRKDLPRVLPEFDHLAVYEVDDTFAAPAAPDGVAGHHFRRYRRPGQGILTGRPTIGLSLVLISPQQPEQAQNLRDWADFVHIRHAAPRAAIGELTRQAWERHGRAFSEQRLTPELLAEVEQGATSGIAAAPVHVVVCADIDRGLEATVGSSIFPAIQNLLL